MAHKETIVKSQGQMYYRESLESARKDNISYTAFP
jgi:hypothetical protein